MKREKKQQLGHLIAGIIALVQGFASFELGDFEAAAMYLGLGVLFLIVAGSLKWMVTKFMQVNMAFFLIEALTFLTLGWKYKSTGPSYIYYSLMVIGLLFTVFSILSLITDEKPRRKSKRRKRRRSGEDRFPSTRQPRKENSTGEGN